MKVAFDEHVAPKLVKGLKALAETGGMFKGVEFVSARDYTEDDDPKDDDTPWVKRFHLDGGTVIVSGDKKMRGRPHERKALKDCGMIVFFFHGSWAQLKNHEKVAKLVNKWPEIEQLSKKSKPGQFWEIPKAWSGELKDVTGPEETE